MKLDLVENKLKVQRLFTKEFDKVIDNGFKSLMKNKGNDKKFTKSIQHKIKVFLDSAMPVKSYQHLQELRNSVLNVKPRDIVPLILSLGKNLGKLALNQQN